CIVAAIEAQLARPAPRDPDRRREKKREPACRAGDSGVREFIAIAPQVEALRKRREKAAHRAEQATVVGIRTHEQNRLVQPLDLARAAQARMGQFFESSQLARRERRAESILDAFESTESGLRHGVGAVRGGSYWPPGPPSPAARSRAPGR